MTHDAETVADGSAPEEPRWLNFTASFAGASRFLGRAGPIDIWLDTGDTAVPFLAKSKTHQRWANNAERVIETCEDERIHLTLHDECRIHTLCAPHNTNHNGDHQ